MPLPTRIIEAPLRLLGEHKVDCVIVGGVAAAIHGSSLLTYEAVVAGSVKVELFGYQFVVIDIGKLITAKRAAGRPKDLLALPELEAIQDAQAITNED